MKLVILLALMLAAHPLRADVLDILAATPAGNWVRLNLNRYADVWAPAAQRPLYGLTNNTPARIMSAWGGAAWDTNRARMWVYGGGHGNYSGNDVYYWSAVTQRWHRAALPSEIANLGSGTGNTYVAIDGPDFAPAAAHTYDNNIFLPVIDRLLTFGGGTFNSGRVYQRAASSTTFRATGPYLFNPSLADPNKVGGSHGSHVKRVAPFPEVQGGFMWQNRDLYSRLTMPGSYLNSCTAYAKEGGKDVVYVAARRGSSTARDLHRYVIHDVDTPAADSWQLMGVYWSSSTDQNACGFDPVRRLFVRASGTRFVYWSLAAPGPNNREVFASVADSAGTLLPLISAGTLKLRNCGFDFDPVRRNWKLWCGDGRVWTLRYPASPGAQWTIAQEPTPSGAVPVPSFTNGIIGKFAYARNLDAFVGLANSTEGYVWAYKPIGWKRPAALIAEAPPPGGALATLIWDYEEEPALSGFRLYCSAQDDDWAAAEMVLSMAPDVGQATIGYVPPRFCVVRAFDAAGVESDDSNAVELPVLG